MSSAETAEPRIYGGVLLNNFRAFEDVVGHDAFQKAIAGLPKTVADEYHAIVPVAWVPVSMADAVFAAIAEQAGLELDEVFPRVIERGLEKTLNTAWRWVLHLVSDRVLLSRAPKIFAKTYDRGTLEAEFPAPGRIVAKLSEWPDVPHFRLLATAAGIRTVLRLTGRRDVTCEVDRTPDGALFRGQWTK
jgi:hypothetical protein